MQESYQTTHHGDSTEFPHAATGTYTMDGLDVDVTFDFDEGDPETGAPDCLQVYEVKVNGRDIISWMSKGAIDRLMYCMAMQGAERFADDVADQRISAWEATQWL